MTRICCANCSNEYYAKAPLIWTVCPQCGSDDDGWDLDDAASRLAASRDAEQQRAGSDNAKLELLQERLAATRDQDELARLLLEPPVEGCQASVLFAVRSQLACCGAASGTSTPPEELEALVVPLNTESLLQRSCAELSVGRVRVQEDVFLRMVAGYLRLSCASATEAIAAPIAVRKRVFLLLCLFSDAEGFGPRSVDELRQVREWATTSLTRHMQATAAMPPSDAA